jgi:hypothetical protein
VEEDFWTNQEKLFEEEANELIQPFTMSEVEATLKDMDSNFAPGPDVCLQVFTRECGQSLKE